MLLYASNLRIIENLIMRFAYIQKCIIKWTTFWQSNQCQVMIFWKETLKNISKGILVSKNSFYCLVSGEQVKSSVLAESIKIDKCWKPWNNCHWPELPDNSSIHDLLQKHISLPHTWETKMRGLYVKAQTFLKKIDRCHHRPSVEEIRSLSGIQVKLRNVALSHTTTEGTANSAKEFPTKYWTMVWIGCPFYLKILQKPIKHKVGDWAVPSHHFEIVEKYWYAGYLYSQICITSLEDLGISQKLLGGVRLRHCKIHRRRSKNFD